jgi:membrane-bound lytic murein transglycosylase F
MLLIKRSEVLIILLVSIVLLLSLNFYTQRIVPNVSRDLDSIKTRGRLIALTDNNSTNYFIYRGEPMGFHYDLLKAFADHLGVTLEIITENDPEKAFDILRQGKADILATGFNDNLYIRKKIGISDPIYYTPQVLIQRKPLLWQNLTEDSIGKALVRNHKDLAGKTIYVQDGSPNADRLRKLSKEINGKIIVRKSPYDPEKLIEMVEDEEIDFAVCDENISVVNSTYYPDLDVSTVINSPQGQSWGVRKTHSWDLLNEINLWIKSFRKTQDFALLYAKYFRNSRSSRIVKSDYYALNTGKVSQWDDLIKEYSDSIRWDWRLLASLICQESRFNPHVRSWAGAYGLMQIMPATGKSFGIDIKASPANNIKAGTLYINSLQKIFDPRIPDENERFRFILAAYNAGPGHILDAMKLAEKHGNDPKIWEGNVAKWLLKKSDPEYYKDTVVKNGYFMGRESVAFVDEIMARYEHYKNIIPFGNKE